VFDLLALHCGGFEYKLCNLNYGPVFLTPNSNNKMTSSGRYGNLMIDSLTVIKVDVDFKSGSFDQMQRFKQNPGSSIFV